MNVGSCFLGPKPLSSFVLLLLDRSVSLVIPSHNDALGRLASDSSGSRLLLLILYLVVLVQKFSNWNSANSKIEMFVLLPLKHRVVVWK